MTFSEALKEMKKGKRVTCELWSDEDYCIWLSKNREKFFSKTYMGICKDEYSLTAKEILSNWEIAS